MTVAEIQEYIDNTHQAILEKQCSAEDKILDYDLLMFQVKSMLDELPRDYAQETINDMEKALDNAWKKVLGSGNK